MKYLEPFSNAIKYCHDNDLLYLGTGNPTAKVLIIGKECGMDNGGEQYNKEIKNNLSDWERNSNNNICVDDILQNYNPLYPYKGGSNKVRRKNKEGEYNNGTSQTWVNYQKLKNEMLRENTSEIIDFHDRFFLTELSEIPNKNSRKNDRETQHSIEERLKFIKKSRFFQGFPIVILACNNYINESEIQDTFNVFPENDKIKLSKGNWLGIYHSKDNKKLVIHTRQFSNTISNKLIGTIAKMVREHTIMKN